MPQIEIKFYRYVQTKNSSFQREIERQRLMTDTTKDQPDTSRLSFVDQALGADSTTLDALRAMQVLHQAQSEAWEHRFVLLLPEKAPDAHRHAREGLRV